MMMTSHKGKEPYLSVTEAAGLVGVTRQTIYEWINGGRLRTRELAGRRVLFRSQVQKLADERRRASLAALPVAS